jgi:hypothetical protein
MIETNCLESELLCNFDIWQYLLGEKIVPCRLFRLEIIIIQVSNKENQTFLWL